MRFDDRAADRQAYAQAVGLRRIEILKDAFRIFRIDPWTRILHCDRDGIGPGFRGLDQQFSRSVVDVVHCFNGVDAQVQKHLFQLDQISINERQVLRELRLDRDAVLLRFNAGDCFAYDAAARTI